MQREVVLASSSPRRRELLARLMVPFIVDAKEVDENITGAADAVVLALAQRKALAVRPHHPDKIILAADTLVYCDEILGKPRDEKEAFLMLRKLSGRWHEVYTGVCAIYGEEIRTKCACSRVHFVDLSDEEIFSYINTGDPLDKAGAYGIQGMAGAFIDEISGCPHNVMGLPLALTKRLLMF